MTKKSATPAFLTLAVSCLIFTFLAAFVLPSPAGAEDASILPPATVTPSAVPAFAAGASPEQEMQTRLQTLRDQARTMAADLAAGRSISDGQYQAFAAVMAQIKSAHQTLTEQFDLRAATVQSLGGVAVDRQAVVLISSS